jgi:hypothetical protein
LHIYVFFPEIVILLLVVRIEIVLVVLIGNGR